MPWTRFTLDGLCAHCWEPVKVGEPAYQGRHPKPMCDECTLRILKLTAPADIPAYVPPTPVPETTFASEMSRFSRPTPPNRVREAIKAHQRDVRMLQTGEGDD